MGTGTKLIAQEGMSSGMRIFLKHGYGDGHYGTLPNGTHCHPYHHKMFWHPSYVRTSKHCLSNTPHHIYIINKKEKQNKNNWESRTKPECGTSLGTFSWVTTFLKTNLSRATCCDFINSPFFFLFCFSLPNKYFLVNILK